MRFKTIGVLAAVACVLSASAAFAQAFGEYGRAVGNVPHGKTVTGSKGTGRAVQGKPGKGAPGGVPVPEGRALPARLVVTANEARLYPRQDEESEKIDQLNKGELLTPMMRSSGGPEWFMVKTEKGVIGWVKSADVMAEHVKK